MTRKNTQTTEYTIRQAAWLLGVKRSAISRMIRNGTLTAIPRHGSYVIPASALRRLLGSPMEEPSTNDGQRWHRGDAG